MMSVEEAVFGQAEPRPFYVDTPITVRYGETDMMGVVYHANYLLYFEDARMKLLGCAGLLL